MYHLPVVPVTLLNNDILTLCSDLKHMSLMKLRTTGPMLPDGYKLTIHIHISKVAAQCARVFTVNEVTQKTTSE